MTVVQVVLGVVLLVLAACMSAASEVLLTRANPGLRMPLWGKYSEPSRTPTAARVLMGLGAGAAILGAGSLDAASPEVIVWWLAAVALAVVILPGILIRVSIRLLQRLRSGRAPVQHGH